VSNTNGIGPSVGSTELGFSEDVFMRIISDGTTTVATVVERSDNPFASERARGRGVARRRKGDPRNPALAATLAVGRALRDASNQAEEVLRKNGYEL
jgi:hypothetical protein